METDVRATGSGGAVAVELWLEEPDRERPIIVDGKPLLPVAARRDRQEVTLSENGSQRVRFRLRGLPPGVHQGSVTITGGDALPVDDVRYFAVAVREGWPVLVAAPRDVNTSFLTEAIAPAEYRQNQRARFDCTVVEQSQLANQTLDGYDVVCLVDPEPLTPTAWEQLGRYVERGGNLAVFLGYHAQPLESFQSEPARRLLGGKLARQWRSGGQELYLAPRSYEHPVLAPFRPLATSVPWERSPVFRHWVLDDLAADTSVVIPYGNGQAALLERSLGKGRVMTMTTPISDPARPRGRAAWNELPTSEDAWPYFVLVNELMLYLAGAGESQLNYTAGETAVLRNDPNEAPPRYQLFTPAEEPQEVQATEGRLTITFTERPGAYRLKGNLGGPVVRGFAVNLPARASELARLPRPELDQLLGEGRYQLARNEKEIVREVGETRVGREFYPYLLALLVVILALEHLLSNRFYRRQETPEEASSREWPAATHGAGTGGSRTDSATPGKPETRRTTLVSP